MSSPTYGIHWFRRDLRITGNPALARNLVLHPGRVLGVFTFDKKFLARPDFSAHRFLFFLKTLESLREEMRERGGDLLFLDTGPAEAFPALFASLQKIEGYGLPKTVTWNRDYEPFARERDAAIERLIGTDFGIEILTERDHLFLEPTELSKEDPKLPGGGFYQVYTPFKKKWLAHFESPEGNSRMREVARGLKRGPEEFALRWPEASVLFPSGVPSGVPFGKIDLLREYREETERRVSPELRSEGPAAGHAAAKTLLRTFRDEAIATYGEDRDRPGLSGTSKMSIYLKNGSITVPQIIALLKLTPKSPPDSVKYLQELIWREFYYHILYHRPDVEKEAFLPKYRKLKWENNERWFEAWREGRTGFPIVDAGMRQLNATGWMHNRVRMIVASFLTKDLLIDYRWGERYFMEKLLDGDLAPNNGGWQWAASTGCDPQPYFRIFNPTSQGEKFDPDGAYLRRWAPEFALRPADEFHAPLRPIVDHAKQRALALELFKKID